jgi:hypothetical protein
MRHPLLDSEDQKVDLTASSSSLGVDSVPSLSAASFAVRQHQQQHALLQAGGGEMDPDFVLDFAQLNMGRVLGSGSSATVHYATLNGSPVAVKRFSVATITPESWRAFSKEMAICARVRHPNVVQTLGVCIQPPDLCGFSSLPFYRFASVATHPFI